MRYFLALRHANNIARNLVPHVEHLFWRFELIGGPGFFAIAHGICAVALLRCVMRELEQNGLIDLFCE